jgi:hypothetical protein
MEVYMKRFIIPAIVGALTLGFIGCDKTTYEKKETKQDKNGNVSEYHKTVKENDHGDKSVTVQEHTDKK